MEHLDSDATSSSSDEEENAKDKDNSESDKEKAERHKSVVLPCYLNRLRIHLFLHAAPL
jgi:hypothetical protein